MITSFDLGKLILNNLYKFEVPIGTKLVLIYLVNYYNPANKYVFPKQKTIKKCAGIGLNSVKRGIAELEKLNIIEKTRKFSNLYKLNIQKIFDIIKNGTLEVPNLDIESPKMGLSNITNKEQIKEQDFIKKNFDKNLAIPKQNIASIDETKELLQEYKDMQLTTDYTNWNRAKAINHLMKGIPHAFLSKSAVAKYLINKFNILPEEYLDNESKNIFNL